MNTYGFWATIASLSVSGAAYAHHSTAMYDYSKSVPLVGTVKQWQFTNPHSFIQLLVTDAKDVQKEWSIEAGPVSHISVRLGWNKDLIKPGDKITVVVAPMKDGTSGATLRTLTLPNGKVVSSATADVGADASGRPVFGGQAPATQPVPASKH